MAKETRKLRRAAQKQQSPSGKELRAQFKQAPSADGAPEMPDPLGPEQMKKTLTRVGLILGAIWLVGALVAGISHSETVMGFALGVPAVLTVVIAGVLLWTLRRTKSAREVAEVLKGVQSDEDRKAALEKLSTGKKADPAKIFARAQLEMQEDPKKALETLEQIDLNKVMGPVADEARSQRAMIHLTLNQVNLARQLVDNIQIKRAQDSRSRAMIGAISAETWARSGEAKKALETLELFDLNSEELAQMKPQLLRAYAFAYAHTSKMKELRRILRQMSKIDVRLLGGFLQGKNHPLLQREAKKVVEQSGMVPKRMQVQRMR